MKKKKILITSALPYVNNVPHLGNIIGCVLSADVFARYCRSRGYECLYICGTDEYGTATEIKAIEENVTPQQICDKYHAIHKGIYHWFGIQFDYFGRTSTPRHTEITQDIFLKLHAKGHIIEEEVEQLYDERAQMFLADRYIEGTCPYCTSDEARGDQCDKCGKLLHPNELKNPLSKITKTKPVLRKTKHLFIDLPSIEKKLAAWIEKTAKKGFWSANSYNIAKAWLREGLKRRAITRDLKWGVQVPLEGYEKKVFYVWFDAPIGYLSITANHTAKWGEWWKNCEDVELYQFMGKDNVPFHTVVFPSTLIGTGDNWTLLHHISTTEYLTYEGGKFSKSKHRGVFGDDAMHSGIPPDVWRYYLLSNRPESSDSSFSWEEMIEKTNNELIANPANLVNRTLVFLEKYFNHVVPDATLSQFYNDFLTNQKQVVSEITSLLEKVKIRDALNKIMAYSHNANKYFQDNKPWELVKTDKKRAGTVMYVLSNQVKDLAILLQPFLPHTVALIWKQLSLEEKKWHDAGMLSIAPGHVIGTPAILFSKLEKEQIKLLQNKFAGKEGGKGVSFVDLDLEVGEIVAVEQHPNANKLYVEKIRVGSAEIQVVSGLAGHISKEALLGKKVIVVRNLMPAKLRGVDSQGMLLVAEGSGGMIEILECPHAKPGNKVVASGVKNAPLPHITIKEFAQVKLEIKDYCALAEGKKLYVNNHLIKTKIIKEGKVC